MKNEKVKLSATLGLALAYNFLFWNEYLGLNVLIFYILFISTLYLLNRADFKGINVWLIVLGGLLTAVFLVIHNTILSKIIHILSFTLCVGMIHFPQIKNLLYAFLSSISGLFCAPEHLLNSWNSIRAESRWLQKIYKIIKLLIIPLIFLSIFYGIFIFANLRFQYFSTVFWKFIGTYLSVFFQKISFERVINFSVAFFVLGSVIFKSTITIFFLWDQKGKDQLIRIRNRRFRKALFNMLSLKTEYKIAVLMVAMINVLLFIVNSIDIQWIWFGFDPNTVKNLSQFVHEGTYLLIASILLSMGIIMYFFRYNLNFYKRNKALKILCYAWIIQNTVLCISVALRNYYYVASFGLAYKRIGVFIFLFLTIVGLLTLVMKIRNTYSGFYLWRVNLWSLYAVFVCLCCINWDILIARYNLEIHKKDLDLGFLLSLSDKTTPILYKHRNVFIGYKDYGMGGYSGNNPLDKKINRLTDKMKNCSFLSWNYSDYDAYLKIKSFKQKEK